MWKIRSLRPKNILQGKFNNPSTKAGYTIRRQVYYSGRAFYNNWHHLFYLHNQKYPSSKVVAEFKGNLEPVKAITVDFRPREPSDDNVKKSFAGIWKKKIFYYVFAEALRKAG